jgi:hypothetical protein
MKTAYVVDLDNTYLMSDKLLPLLDNLCHNQFPTISEGELTKTYNEYKEGHNGLVDMPEILEHLFTWSGLPDEQKESLIHLYHSIDLREHGIMMDPDHLLIKQLGLNNVYFLSMGDPEYQQWKFDCSHFPEGFDKSHIDIRGEKNIAVFSEKVKELTQAGYYEIVFINDRVDQLEASYQAGKEGNVRCILINYGKYAERFAPSTPFPYEKVDNFEQLSDLLLHQSVKERMVPISHGEMKG